MMLVVSSKGKPGSAPGIGSGRSRVAGLAASGDGFAFVRRLTSGSDRARNGSPDGQEHRYWPGLQRSAIPPRVIQNVQST
jgi:hypothetical protein